MSDISSEIQQWRKYKQVEIIAIEGRRAVEDKILSLIGIGEGNEKTEKIISEWFELKITPRFVYKIDEKKLSEIEKEKDISQLLGTVIKLKPEISVSEWKKTDQKILDLISDAVTITTGRHSFTLTQKKGE